MSSGSKYYAGSYYTIQEVCDIFGLKPRELRKHIKEGKYNVKLSNPLQKIPFFMPILIDDVAKYLLCHPESKERLQNNYRNNLSKLSGTSVLQEFVTAELQRDILMRVRLKELGG